MAQHLTFRSSRIIYYGPHACSNCGVMIAKMGQEFGGSAFTYPFGPIYPNTEWHPHVCDPKHKSPETFVRRNCYPHLPTPQPDCPAPVAPISTLYDSELLAERRMMFDDLVKFNEVAFAELKARENELPITIESIKPLMPVATMDKVRVEILKAIKDVTLARASKSDAVSVNKSVDEIVELETNSIKEEAKAFDELQAHKAERLKSEQMWQDSLAEAFRDPEIVASTKAAAALAKAVRDGIISK